MYTNSVPALMSKNVGNALSNYKTWGGIVFNVKEYGAIGKGNSYDSTSFQKAIDAAVAVGGGKVVIPPGSFYFDSKITVPTGVILEGSGNSSILFSPGTLDTMISCTGGTLRDFRLSGNNKVSKGISLDGDFCVIDSVYYQYCTYGIYNNSKDVHRIMNTNSDNCTYSIYSANRFINIVIDNFVSNGDGYFFYATYSDQQPQGIRITNGLILGAALGGIYFAKSAYEIIIDGIMMDAIIGNCITIGRGPDNSQFKITNNFIASANSAPDSGKVDIFVGAGTQGVFLENNTLTLAPTWGVYFEATASLRSENVHLVGNTFNDNNRGGGSGDLFIDSVNNVRLISNNFATGTGTCIVTTATNPTPFNIKMIANGFANIPSLLSGNIINRDAMFGYITNNEGVATMNASSTSSVINHGLNATPTKIQLTGQGNLGNMWASNITATQFTANCSSAPGGSTLFSWSAEK